MQQQSNIISLCQYRDSRHTGGIWMAPSAKRRQAQNLLAVLNEDLQEIRILANQARDGVSQRLFGHRLRQSIETLPACEQIFPKEKSLPTWNKHRFESTWPFSVSRLAYIEMMELKTALSDYLKRI